MRSLLECGTLQHVHAQPKGHVLARSGLENVLSASPVAPRLRSAAASRRSGRQPQQLFCHLQVVHASARNGRISTMAHGWGCWRPSSNAHTFVSTLISRTHLSEDSIISRRRLSCLFSSSFASITWMLEVWQHAHAKKYTIHRVSMPQARNSSSSLPFSHQIILDRVQLQPQIRQRSPQVLDPVVHAIQLDDTHKIANNSIIFPAQLARADLPTPKNANAPAWRS